MKNQANILLAKQLEQLRKRTSELIPEIYSAFCKVLYEKYGWTADQIADLFADTQEAWQEIVDKNDVNTMIEWCEQLTGIELKGM